MYCGYANGAFNYFSEIAAQTETYWCGIMHNNTDDFVAPKHHKNFAKYNDEDDFIKKYK